VAKCYLRQRIVLRNTSSSCYIVAGSFAAKEILPKQALTSSVAIGELDGDGKPDHGGD